MKKFSLIITIIIILLISLTACQKKMSVDDYPALLFNTDLTPGEEDKEIAVFLYISKEKVDYEITEKTDDNDVVHTLILKLKNTYKPGGFSELKIDGLEDLIEGAKVFGDINKDNKKNPFTTRYVFKLVDPETSLKVIFQLKKVDVARVEKAINKNDVAVAAVTNSAYGSPEGDQVTGLAIIIGFWLIVGLIFFIYWFIKKINKQI